MNIEHLAHDLFLLMLNLSQFKSQERILTVFLEAMSSVQAGISFRLLAEGDSVSTPTVEIATTRSTFGRIALEGDTANLTDELSAVVRNAIGMLAIILENRAQEALLADENLRLETTVRERTSKLLRATERLERELTERVRAEEALRESEVRWRSLVENAPDIIFTVDREERILFINYAPTGLTVEEALGTNALDYVMPEYRETVRQSIQRVFQTGEPDSYEIAARGPHDTTSWYTTGLGPIKRNGEIVAVMLITRDITERQRAEEEIKQRSRELATLLEVSQALTATLDLNTVLQTSINGAVDLMELGSGAIYLLEGETLYLGATTPPLPPQFPEEFRRAPLADHPHIRQAIATGRPVILPDTATANLTPAERAVSELRGLRSIVYAPLLAAERAVGVWILASVGESHAFSEAEIDLSRTLSTQVALAVENARLYTSVQRHAAELEQRVAERTAELNQRVAEVEQLNCALTNLLEDLQQANRLTAETSRRLEEANTELEAFTYSVSHDLRAPLRAMEGLSQALLEDYADRLDPVGQDYARRIVGAAQRMDTLIQDLLAYSRLSRAEVKLQPVGLEGVVQEALSLLTTEIQEKSAQVAVERPLPRVVGHQATLVRVVENLLSNAVKFVAPDVQPQVRVWAETIADCGLRIVDVGSTQQSTVPKSEMRNAKWVRLWVEDNGIGIAPEHQERIFRIFERLHGVEAYPGTGVGLAIVRKGMERMGGRVGVESEIGQGSRFWVELEGVKRKA